jgi:hypothetical protein
MVIRHKEGHLINHELERIAGTTMAATEFATNGSARNIQKSCTSMPALEAMERSVARESRVWVFTPRGLPSYFLAYFYYTGVPLRSSTGKDISQDLKRKVRKRYKR